MSSLPPELEEFCRVPGRSLLIKGEAGTGKTILSFELLHRFSEDRRTFYISTRVSPQRLLKENPHLRDILKAKDIFDVSKAEKAVTGVYDLTMVDLSTFVDRLYRITEEVINPFVVVDSWSGIAKALEHEERLKAEETLINLCRKADAFVAFVVEEPHQTTVDYLVDGVVELGRDSIEGRPVRTLQLSKLRSTRIARSRYVFTLEGGRFRCFRGFRLSEEWKHGKRQSLDEPSGFISTGSEDLDRVLGGGLPMGSTVLLEIGRGVPSDAHNAITYTMAANALGHGRGVIVIPTLGYPLEEGIKLAEKLFGKKAQNLLRFVGALGVENEKHKKFTVPLEMKSADDDYRSWQQVYNSLVDETGKPVLQLTGMDRQEARYTLDEYRKTMAYSVDTMRESDSVEMRIIKPGLEDLTQRAANISNIHMKLVSVYGTVLLYAETPWSGLYAMRTVVEDGVSKLSLVPVV